MLTTCVVLSLRFRRSRWVWLAWIPAAVLSAAILFLVTWLFGQTFPMSGPGGGGEWVMAVMFPLGVLVGGGLLFLLLWFRPKGDACSYKSILFAASAWLLVFACLTSAIYGATRVTMRFTAHDIAGNPISGATIKWRASSPDLLPIPGTRIKTERVLTTDSSGEARFNTIGFQHAGASVSAPNAATIQVVSVYRDHKVVGGYKVQVIHWENQNGRFGDELSRDPQFNLAPQRELVVPITVRLK